MKRMKEMGVGLSQTERAVAKRRGKGSLILGIGLVALLLAFLAWFLKGIFEGEVPTIVLEPRGEYLPGSRNFHLTAKDSRRGLRKLQVVFIREGREKMLLEQAFPFKGFLNREGVRQYDVDFTVEPFKLGLAQGRVDLQVRVWDYSRRRGGDGNMALLEQKMTVDTIPPAIRALSQQNYINTGGTGLIVYQTSSDCAESGVYVNDLFFPGFSAGLGEGFHACYFAIPLEIQDMPRIDLWAKDRAGNVTRSGFPCRVRKKDFRADRITLTERFMKQVVGQFSQYPFEPNASDLERFLKINRDLRRENAQVFYGLRTKTDPQRLWSGDWLRLKNAAPMAGFGDRRSYFYQDQKVDEQTHMGVDLASLANSEVQAANQGRVIFAGDLGIYGLTVVLDHGQGVASIYSHLSKIDVQLDRIVAKGQTIGITGQTGLAGGDHLHFGIMVNGYFVNPIEWWDPHWIQDNVFKKLAALDKK